VGSLIFGTVARVGENSAGLVCSPNRSCLIIANVCICWQYCVCMCVYAGMYLYVCNIVGQCVFAIYLAQ
jgi:hypothetical protein